jgi:replicative DNA helicase
MEYKGLSDTHGFAELIIAKNRFGPLKDLITKYEGHYTRFSDHESGNEFVPMPF